MDLNELLRRAIRLQQTGRSAEAETIYQRLLEQDSNSAPILCLYGRFLRLEDREDEAKGVLRRARELAPQSPQVHAELGFTALTRSDMSGAVASFRKLVELRPNYPDGHHNLGSAYQAIGDYLSAVKCFRQAIALNLEDADEAYCNLGFALAQTGDTDGAIDCLNQVLTSNPRDPRALFGLGIVDVIRGNFDTAIERYRQVIEIDPSFAAAYQQLAFAKKFEDPEDPDLLAILSSLDDPNREYREKISYAAGKALDDCADYSGAIAHFNTANRLKRNRLGKFDFVAQDKMVTTSIELFNRVFISEQGNINDSLIPIFVVGLPRSGTTLIEQILSSHGDVSGAGELDYFARSVLKDLRPYPTSIINNGLLPSIAQGYIQLLSTFSQGRSRVVDKYPLNFQYVGLLGTLFPNAYFIHCHRNPLDNALSIYFQDFATANLYANSFDDIHRFHNSYLNLMAHWKVVFGSRIFDIEYESLVSDSKMVVSQLLDFLELPFDQRCLEHTQNKRVIQTLSSWQVRQPIYQSSRERWRNYAEFVPELLELFGVTEEL